VPSLSRLSGPLEQFIIPPCAKVDPDIFIAIRKIPAAKRICMLCPKDTRKECLVGALTRGERIGVYGGLSADDRVDLGKRLAAKREQHAHSE
jgi:hypothetical protein